MSDPTHMESVAIRKAGVEGWEPFRYEVIGTDGILVTGGIPRLLKSGPRKGQKTWGAKKGSKVVVTNSEVATEKARYVAETGNCPECYGKGEIFASWHVDHGTKYKPCPHCCATGKARKEAA